MADQQDTGSERYVWLRADSQSSWLWLALGEKLSHELGLRPLLIVSSDQDAVHFRKSSRATTLDIVVADDVYAAVIELDATALDAADCQRRARELEVKYGFGVWRDMILADRHLGRAFLLGGLGHPESTISRSGGYLKSLYAGMRSMEFHEKLLVRYPPALVVTWGGGGGIYGKPLALLCRKHGLPFRAFNSSRFKNWYYWAFDEYASSPELEAAIEKQPFPNPDEINRIQSEVAPNLLGGKAQVNAYVRTLSLKNILRNSVRIYLRRMYWQLRGYRKAKIGYRANSVIASLFRGRRHLRLLNRLAVMNPKKYAGSSRIVYFPLQVEPESSTIVLAPRAANQLGLVLELALTLPADCRLVVKEHVWQLGRRPDGYYEKIAAMPNVILAHPLASSLDIIKGADLVCAISSSAAYEAAVLGRRVCLLQAASALRHLPNVLSGSDASVFAELGAFLNAPPEESVWARHGARYYKGLEAFCVDMGTEPFHLRKAPPTDHEIGILASALMRSVRFTATV